MRYTQPLTASQSKKWQRLTQDLDVDITVTSFSPDLRPRRFDEYAHFYQWPALPLAPLRYLTAYLVVPLLTFWLIMTRHVNVLVAHDPYIGCAAALAKNVARLFGRRVGLVVETRGDLEQALFTQRYIRLKAIYRFFMRLTAGYALRHADVLRAVSSGTGEQLQRLAPDKPMMAFMSWTDSAAFTEVVPQQPVSQRREMVFCGRLVPGKGVHILLDALPRLGEDVHHVWIIGRAPRASAGYVARLQAQIQQNGLTAKVTFIEQVTQAELAQYIARARVFVLPTYSEGMPKVVVEAMLTGTPVVASAVDGIPEVVEDGVHGYLVPPGDVDALAEKLACMFNHADVDRMGQRAREFATRFYSPDAYVQHYGQLFRLAYDKAQGQA